MSSSSNSGLGLCPADCGSEIGGEGRVDMRSQDGWSTSSSVFLAYPEVLVSTTIVEDCAEPVLDIGTVGVRSVDFPLV